jgi:DUF917 family protein
MSATPPQAQAFELGMHAALKAAGVKTAADAEAFFKLANEVMDHEIIEQRRRETYEIGARGVLSNAGVKTAEAQDALIKQALELSELLGKAKDTGGAAVDKTKQLGGAVAGKAKQLGAGVAGALKPGIKKVKEKAPAAASGLREFIKRKLKTLGIG